MKISQMIGCVALATSIVTVVAISAPFKADAANFAFNNIFDANGNTDNTNGDLINNQFSFSVVNGIGANTGKTVWTFQNVGVTRSFINEIYFDSTSPLSNVPLTLQSTGSIVSQGGSSAATLSDTGVQFKSGATPNNLPQNNNIDFNANLAIEPTTEGSDKMGIDLGQQLVLLVNNSNEAAIESRFLEGSLRVGIHVKGIGNNGLSDSYISRLITPTPVPVPGFILGVMAAGALGGTRLLKNKKQAV